jgi:hypothetical protein
MPSIWPRFFKDGMSPWVLSNVYSKGFGGGDQAFLFSGQCAGRFSGKRETAVDEFFNLFRIFCLVCLY